jgi:predicted O-methyltransferase YrrM
VRTTKDIVKRYGFYAHKLLAKAGLHVLPVHYYTCVPDVNELAQTRETWAHRSEMPGITLNLEQQIATLKEICLPYHDEYRDGATYREATRKVFGPGYQPIEAQALHGVLRHYKPNTVIEVGSGVSTCCIADALHRNKNETGKAAELISIEPYPSKLLESFPDARLIRKPVQSVPLDVFQKLESGDLLFIDSSHAVKAGSDVNFLILEVLPRLQPGVIVHFHDIYFPYDYQRDLLKTFLFWEETVLLRAYLTYNDRARVLLCLSLLHYDSPETLSQVFPEYRPQPGRDGLLPDDTKPFAQLTTHFPCSTYIQIATPPNNP